jgi:hypothetical protein
VVEIGDLVLRECGLGIEVAHVKGPLDIVLDPRPGVADDPHGTRDSAHARRSQPHPGAAIDDQEPAVSVPPNRALQRIELVAGQELVCPLPDQRRFGDVRVAIKSRKSLVIGAKR